MLTGYNIYLVAVSKIYIIEIKNTILNKRKLKNKISFMTLEKCGTNLFLSLNVLKFTKKYKFINNIIYIATMF